jgi:hypothetical protein
LEINIKKEEIISKGKNNIWKKKGVGSDSGGEVGGFESGGESNTSTLECRVVSNPPHSQGEIKFKIQINFLFFWKKNAHLWSHNITSDRCS